MKRVELGFYDSRARILAQRNPPSDEIVIVAIDEESLQRLAEAEGGRLSFPWPRSVYAYILDYCSAADAIFLDVILGDPDRDPDGKLHDALFVDVAKQMKSLVFSISLAIDESPILRRQLERIPEDILTDDRLRQAGKERPPYGSVVMPFPDLRDAGNRMGHVRYHPDKIDGTLRRYQLIAPLENGKSLPSAALATAQAVHDIPKGSKALGKGWRVTLGDNSITTNPAGQFHILPTSKIHTAYRVANIIASKQQEAAWLKDPDFDPPLIPRDAFKGKTVIFGSLAEGLTDTVITPFDNYTPGMVVHAMALDNLLEGKQIYVSPMWLRDLLIILVVLLVVLPRDLGSRRTFLLGIGLSTVIFILGYGILFVLPFMLPLAAPILATWLGTLIIGGHTWYIDERERQRQKELEMAKQAFTDMLVHDIKNAVAPMSLAMEFIQDDEINQEPELLGEFISTADEAQSNLLYLVGNLLDIRKLEEGRLPVNKEPIDAREFFPEISRMFQSIAKRKRKPIVLKVQGGTAMQADPGILRRVIENLLWNALAYGSENEEITLHAAEKEAHWQIQIANACKVINPDNLARLFDAYVSGENGATNMPMRSTGLGLAFSKMAVNGHGGTIAARSPRPGSDAGIEFTILLPKR